MQLPISSSVAGVVGLSNARESRLNATGGVPVATANTAATKPLEENTNIGDRDAQEQYLRDNDNKKRHPQEQSDAPELNRASFLQLPADDNDHGELDLIG